jgi:outer membrane scaffolding protein for murein synthesis (MipA/OmpV family)
MNIVTYRATPDVVRLGVILLLCIVSLPFSALCFAEELAVEEPLWELGLSAATARLPHYRGSDEYTWWTLPIPYFVYRGEIFKATRDGLRGILFDSDYFEASVSLSGNPPVDNDNKARENMPDLDAIFEVGPSLKLFFWERHQVNKLYLKGSFRAASSVNFDDGLNLAYQGLNSGIDLVYRNRQFYERYGSQFRLTTGVNFANRERNSYFYDVDKEFVTEDRSFFSSDAGYASFSLSVAISQVITKDISIGFYSRWDNLDGAVYEDSPLVREKNNFIIGSVLIWTIGRSNTMVKSDD